ncbi:MAG: hypothetical protein ACOC32_03440 [Nanoarchaeota archaeon]
MKQTTQELVMDFFKGQFGGLMSKSLFEQYYHKYHVKDLSALNKKDQIAFGQKIIRTMYSRFYDESRVRNMEILYLLKFSMNEAVEKVESMIKAESDVKIERLENVDEANMDMVLQPILDEEKIKFGFECSNMLEGLLMMVMDKEIALDFANTLIRSMMEMEPENKTELDEMKLSAISEFFNILLPAFVRIIGDTYGQELYFTPLSYEEFKGKYFFEDEFISPHKTLRSGATFRVNQNEEKSDVFFFIKQSDEHFQGLVDQGKANAKDPFEEAPPQILVDRTGNRRTDLEALFRLLGLKVDNIDYILKIMGIPNVEMFNFHAVSEFYQILIMEFLKAASGNKKATIRVNLEAIFGFR